MQWEEHKERSQELAIQLWAARRNLKRRRAALATIAAWVPQMRARMAVLRAQRQAAEQEQAAVLLQSSVRAWLARRQRDTQRQAAQQEQAAVLLQSGVRAWLARRQRDAQRQAAQQEQAAVLLQSGVRTWLAYKQKDAWQQAVQLEQAAVLLQSSVRAWLARRQRDAQQQAVQQEQAAVLLQSGVHMWLACKLKEAALRGIARLQHKATELHQQSMLAAVPLAGICAYIWQCPAHYWGLRSVWWGVALLLLFLLLAGQNYLRGLLSLRSDHILRAVGSESADDRNRQPSAAACFEEGTKSKEGSNGQPQPAHKVGLGDTESRSNGWPTDAEQNKVARGTKNGNGRPLDAGNKADNTKVRLQ
ncbi:hypothetical protein DUNSADRAFT_14193 [Dunaliella salina]|uniref:Uncharacterized protein n=1 Tax=Dunaliella salina TaxID=3046 RepID=A0ABQ7G7V4_DUNSA|nr:hypothetical protein DUNSADRAFT_14193 [Dunaliella salina]|eukprot:KAF5830678.1 hypothetical protein DUNSADRAFT_14193 [Dunaliella salina]